MPTTFPSTTSGKPPPSGVLISPNNVSLRLCSGVSSSVTTSSQNCETELNTNQLSNKHELQHNSILSRVVSRHLANSGLIPQRSVLQVPGQHMRVHVLVPCPSLYSFRNPTQRELISRPSLWLKQATGATPTAQEIPHYTKPILWTQNESAACSSCICYSVSVLLSC